MHHCVLFIMGYGYGYGTRVIHPVANVVCNAVTCRVPMALHAGERLGAGGEDGGARGLVLEVVVDAVAGRGRLPEADRDERGRELVAADDQTRHLRRRDVAGGQVAGAVGEAADRG